MSLNLNNNKNIKIYKKENIRDAKDLKINLQSNFLTKNLLKILAE